MNRGKGPPIARGNVVDDPVLTEIGSRHGKSSVQVTLRWHIQRGDVVFPKTSTRERMRENLSIFDFELTAAELSAIDALDRGERLGPHPDQMNRT